MRIKSFLFLILFLPVIFSCSGSKKVLSSSDNTALFLPIKIEAYVDMFVDEVDGEKTSFNLADSVEVDAGKHNILVRLEYQPAAASSIIVGGLGNLLLRSATNKTFSSKIDIQVQKNMEYRIVVKDFEDGFDIILFNETKKEEESIYSFKLKDGKFERMF